MNSKILRNSGQDSTEVQNNKNHCFILLLPQICNSVQKKSKTIRSLRKILSCKESCNLIAQSDFDNIAQTRFPPIKDVCYKLVTVSFLITFSMN